MTSPEDYAVELLGRDEALERILARCDEAGLPTIAIQPLYGRLLTLLASACGASRALEIGTLGGYGAACLARGLGPEGWVVSLELDRDRARLAERNLREAGLGDRVEVRVGDAHASLAAMNAAGERFDFVFIDADKESYPAYLDAVLRLARPGALIAADNALFHGRVLDAHDGSDAARALRDFNRTVAAHPRLSSALLPAFDGLMLARVGD